MVVENYKTIFTENEKAKYCDNACLVGEHIKWVREFWMAVC